MKIFDHTDSAGLKILRIILLPITIPISLAVWTMEGILAVITGIVAILTSTNSYKNNS